MITRKYLLIFSILGLSMFVWPASGRQKQSKPMERLVFMSNRDNPNIYIMNADGTGEKRLTNDMSIQVDPSLSPNHEQIAYIVIGDKPRIDLYNVKLAKSKTVYSSPKAGAIFGPIWSADSRTIYFSKIDQADGLFKALRMDSTGTNVAEIGAGALPTLSPDGKSLLCTQTDLVKHTFNLVRMGLDGTDPKTLVPNAMGGSWSPDGKSIAYIGMGKSDGITVANADGSEPKNIYPGDSEHIPCRPVWSADGSRLFFTRLPKNGTDGPAHDICTIEIATRKLKRLSSPDYDSELGYGTSYFVILKQASDRSRSSLPGAP